MKSLVDSGLFKTQRPFQPLCWQIVQRT